tara:strand:+ start:527 stop:1153 length:627 start_codon:yes stop_codon:yes gene_type:complete
MNRFFYITFFLSSFLLSSCNIIPEKVEKSIIIIEQFNLNQYSKNGSKVYMLDTPYSVFNQTDQSYLFNKTNIKFFEKEKVKYNINSDSATLLNNKFLELKGNVEINDLNNDKTIIKSNKLSWNIDNSEILLDGNVKLVNKIINLSSSKALLDKNSDIIIFYNPVKYNYNDEDSVKKYNISSENAYYNIVTKDVIFYSENNKVKSKLVF